MHFEPIKNAILIGVCKQRVGSGGRIRVGHEDLEIGVQALGGCQTDLGSVENSVGVGVGTGRIGFV
ncbi:MAG: hypothetical protein IH991_13105, partial [Planctomycetes bacterium]|nr:hypothetical protein [Planctomycetota bacterium]